MSESMQKVSWFYLQCVNIFIGLVHVCRKRKIVNQDSPIGHLIFGMNI